MSETKTVEISIEFHGIWCDRFEFHSNECDFGKLVLWDCFSQAWLVCDIENAGIFTAMKYEVHENHVSRSISPSFIIRIEQVRISKN